MDICGLMLRPRDVCTIEHRQENGWWMKLERKEKDGVTALLLHCPVTHSAWKELEAFMVPHADLVMEKVFVATGRFVFMVSRNS
jgi:hypothetical protein